MSADEAAAMLDANLDANEQNRDKSIKSVNFQTGLNTTLNVVGLGLSGFNMAGAVKAIAGKTVTKAAAGLTDDAAKILLQDAGMDVTDDAIKAVVQNGGDDIAKTLVERSGKKVTQKAVNKVLKNAANTAYKDSLLEAGKNIYFETFKSGAAKLATLPGKAAGSLFKSGASNFVGRGNFALQRTFGAAQMVTGAGIIAAPSVATQLYTRSISNAKSEELTDTINTLANQVAFLESGHSEMSEEMSDIYNDWYRDYSKQSTALLEQYSDHIDEKTGKFTSAAAEAEYTKKYEEFATESKKQLDELNVKYPEYGKHLIENASAYSASTYMIENDIDPDVVMDNSEYVDDIMSNPENAVAYENAVRSYELHESNNKGSDFANLIASIHSTIIHYAPVFAYAEAAVAKGLDKGLELIDDYIGIDHVEQYAGKNIDDIASAISDDAEAIFKVNAEQKALAESNIQAMSYDGPESDQAIGGPAMGV